jgi:tungstate transport system substrate-binding protein
LKTRAHAILRRLQFLLAAATVLVVACDREAPRLVLATTTSVGNAGLLDRVLPAYEKQHPVQFGVHLAGSGRALAMMAARDADVVISHAPEAETAALRQHKDWWYRKIMFNDFLIVGPSTDPAHVRDSPSRYYALQRIAESDAGIVSRGDGSGTDERERALWQQAGTTPAHSLTTGQGMANTLRITSERGAYTLTDRATWDQFKSQLSLEPLVEGDPRLLNTYAVVVGPGERYDDAMVFAQWLTEGAGRQVIASVHGFNAWPIGMPAIQPQDAPIWP